MAAAPRIVRLARIAEQEPRTILGLMSGTSLDGLDMALCRVWGHGAATRVELRHFTTDSYTPEEQARLRAMAYQETLPARELTVAHGWLAWRHGQAVLAALRQWEVRPQDVDCLASHGQTVYHAPPEAPAPSAAGGAPEGPRAGTLQIGDGDRLAVETGILTISDFRQKEIAGGGQGAPLAPYVDGLLFGRSGGARILLNLGGIANFTYLPPEGEAAPPVSGDTGPANTLIDLAVRRHFPEKGGYDIGGAIAAAGRTDRALLERLNAHPYFALPFPKSTGQETFGEGFLAEAEAAGLAPADLVATLTQLSVDTIADALRREVPRLDGAEVYLSGGGRHNRTLLDGLALALPEVTWRDTAALEVPPDAKEAVLFAVLANELLCGEGFLVAPGAAAGETGQGPRRLAFGKISFPD